jgi:hypothetical protein
MDSAEGKIEKGPRRDGSYGCAPLTTITLLSLAPPFELVRFGGRPLCFTANTDSRITPAPAVFQAGVLFQAGVRQTTRT